MPLIERVGRNIRLTAAGELLADHAATLLTSMERAENELAGYTGQISGRLRISAFSAAITQLIVPRLPELAGRYPGLRIEVEHDESDQALHRLALGEVDLVLVDEYEHFPLQRDRRLSHHTLLSESVRIALPSRHPLTDSPGPVSLSALAGAIWAAGTPGTSHASLVTQVCNRIGGFHPDVRHRSDDPAVLLALVGRASATTLLPGLVDAGCIPSVAVRDIAGRRPVRRVLTWVRRTSAVRPATKAVLEALYKDL